MVENVGNQFISSDRTVFENRLRIQTIHRDGLHLVNYQGAHEIVQLLLTNRALISLDMRFDRSIPEEFQRFLRENSHLFSSNEQIGDIEYIQWSFEKDDLIVKRREFRKQIDLYKTYDNQHHLVSKLLFDIIHCYIKEYLIELPRKDANTTESFFQKAIDEQDYLKYFIKAYTCSNNFHKVLNKHLALYIVDYLDNVSYSSLGHRYRLINCLVHIVTLFIHHPKIDHYTYRGWTYRGVMMIVNDLKHYTVGSYILNRSFLSTSKNRSVAQMFITSNRNDSDRVSVIFKFTIKQSRTAVAIEHHANILDEREVLILPFAVFQVKDRIDNDPTQSPPVDVELDLEECDEEELLNKRQISHPMNEREKHSISTWFYLILSLCFVVALTIAVVFLTRPEDPNRSSFPPLPNSCPPLINRAGWNATEAKKLH